MALPLGVRGALPGRHGGETDPTGPLWSDWSLEPTVIVGVLALVGAYLYATGRGRGRAAADPPVTAGQRAAFLGGAATLLIALGPPLDDWADHYLLSAHMVQHLLLTLLAAPLLLLGTPGWLFAPVLRRPALARISRALTRPVIAFVLANAAFTVWHVPVLYEAALRTEAVHVLEHQVFLLTALLAWWPLLSPVPAWPRLSLPMQCLYYGALTIPGSIVGAFITLAAPGLYQPYDLARRIFDIDLATDQEIAGLIMWVGTSTVYLLLITITFFRWAAREEATEQAARAAVPRRPKAVGGSS